MTTEIRILPNEPIIIFKMMPPPKMPDDVVAVHSNTAKLKHETGLHVYRITDFTPYGDSLPFSSMVQGMAEELHVEGGINDMEVSSIYIVSGKIASLGVDAFRNQPQYGKTNILQVCANVDEAIGYARADIASKKK